MMKKPDNVVFIPGDIDSFFRNWFEFLKPFHHLTDRECDIAAAFVKLRWELGQNISDQDLLDKVLMTNESKQIVKDRCGTTMQHFQVIMSKLKKNRVIIDGKLNPKFIPNLQKDSDSFKLLLYFKI